MGGKWRGTLSGHWSREGWCGVVSGGPDDPRGPWSSGSSRALTVGTAGSRVRLFRPGREPSDYFPAQVSPFRVDRVSSAENVDAISTEPARCPVTEASVEDNLLPSRPALTLPVGAVPVLSPAWACLCSGPRCPRTECLANQ